ncbi:MAG: TatD family hydrolase [Clostridium sp.]|nr:TatD family hydrolase [Clostridium sp.]
MLIDTHTHIDMENFENRFDEVIQKAKDYGVEKIVIPGVEPKGFERIACLCEKYENVYGAVGVHPEEVNSFDENALELMKQYLKNPKIIAVGEIGLDYYWDKSQVELQKEIFEKQILLAKEAGKPVLVHDREAHLDSFEILKKTKANEVGVVMHCFSGSPEFAMECVREGFYIALGGVVTFKNAKKAKEVAKIVPLDRLLLETDAPYMAPVPFRGKENEPAYVKFVAEEIAQLREISFEEVAEATTANARKLLNIS